MRSILIGAVNSSKIMLEEMIKTNFPVNMVFSLDEKFSGNVSGYYPIHEIARSHDIPYQKFGKINDREHIDVIKEINPDYIFIIGLSQLVGSEIINAAKKGTVGFHPTALPELRGRAAMVWQILLDVRKTKCTLFFIDEGMDSGDIIDQEEYIIEKNDYVMDASLKNRSAFKRLIRRALPGLLNETIEPVKQNEEKATYLLKRTPEDGLIDWNDSSEDIQRLIRAVSRPYPGAFSLYDGRHKVIFWKANFMENNKYFGLPGQIANITEEFIDIVCRDGLLRVYEYENIDDVKLIVGNKFRSIKRM